jgi:hypothetical protein
LGRRIVDAPGVSVPGVEAERRIKLPKDAAQLWAEAWEAAVARAEIVRGLARAGFDGALEGDLARACLRALLPRIRPEIIELRRLDRRRWRHVLGLSFVAAVGVIWFLQFNGISLLPWWWPPSTRQLIWLIAAGAAAFVALFTLRAMLVRMRQTLEVRMRLKTALDGLLLPHLRRRINDALHVPFDTLEVREANGLAETVDPSLEVATSARVRLTALMERMGSGAIGVSGARGAGKSTLIRAACGGRLTPAGALPTVGVSVSAPVRWEADEFVPLLFAELCKAIAPDLGEHDQSRRSRIDLILGFGAIVATALLLYLATAVGKGSVTIREEHLEAVALGFAAVAVVALSLPLLQRGALPALLLLLPRRLRVRLERLRRPPLAATAARCLHELRFRETIVKGWSVGARSPLGLGLDGKRELSATRQPLTLPEVVARYKQFVRRVAEERTLVIGIDELDKMASAEEAAKFLGDVKVLFGEQPCFYLVSVSDDAMSEFERRGVPLRTVFDSTFDDVLHVETLSFAEARAIVNGRVVGMGDGYVAVCFILGDGIPRELIRYVRGVIESSARGATTLGEVTRVLVADRQRRIERAATSVALRQLGGGGDHPLVDWLRALPDPAPEALALRWDPAGLRASMGPGGTPEPGQAEQWGLVAELAAVAYRAATLVALADALDDDVLAATARESDPSRVLALLARAGRDLGHGPRTAWRTIDSARVEMGLPCVPFPLDRAASTEGVAAVATGGRRRWRRAIVALLG